MLKNATLLIGCCLFLTGVGRAQQLGGRSTYAFLNLPVSARITALGGHLISVFDDDVAFAYANPAVLNPSMHQQLSFNHKFHIADIQTGYVAYGRHIEKWRSTWHTGIQYVNYGEMEALNELAEPEGLFKVAEYAVVLGGAYQLDERFSVGLNTKWISSQLAGFQSMGLAADLGGIFSDTSRLLQIAFVAKNIGRQISTYEVGGAYEPLPFEMQLGISKRLRYLPFRFSVVYRYFDRWNILYDDPNAEDQTPIFGQDPTERSNTSLFFDNLLRHFVFSGELLLGSKENLRLRFGYNALLGREMSLDNFRSAAGFTFGFGIKVNRFRLDYGRMSYHLGSSVNHLSISTNFQEFKSNN